MVPSFSIEMVAIHRLRQSVEFILFEHFQPSLLKYTRRFQYVSSIGMGVHKGCECMSLPPIDLSVFHDNGYVRKQCRVTDFGFGLLIQKEKLVEILVKMSIHLLDDH